MLQKQGRDENMQEAYLTSERLPKRKAKLEDYPTSAVILKLM